jgi:vacuolar-type H+-ATPase subunit E/Vma4
MTTPQQDYETYKRAMKKAHTNAQAGQQEATEEQREAAEDHIIDAAAVPAMIKPLQSTP